MNEHYDPELSVMQATAATYDNDRLATELAYARSTTLPDERWLIVLEQEQQDRIENGLDAHPLARPLDVQ